MTLHLYPMQMGVYTEGGAPELVGHMLIDSGDFPKWSSAASKLPTHQLPLSGDAWIIMVRLCSAPMNISNSVAIDILLF